MTKRSILPPTYQSIHIVDISGVIPRLVLNAVELNFKVQLLSFKEKISIFFSQYYSLLILAMITLNLFYKQPLKATIFQLVKILEKLSN